jgi:hypothetical protein
VPSRIAFEISIFPNNVPLPSPKTSACLIGGALHFIHFCIRVSQIRSIPESDTGWEDMYREDNNVAWFDWVRSYLITFTSRVSGQLRNLTNFALCFLLKT